MKIEIKSQDRVKNFGEVFTSLKDINSMLDLIPEFYKIDNSILEPTCGNGNFIEEILIQKLNRGVLPQLNNKNYFNLIQEMLNNIFGMDIQEDNVKETQERIIKNLTIFYIDNEIIYNENEFNSYKKIINNNIIVGNFLENYKKYNSLYAIIGNPPYQKDDNGFGASASPLYNIFMEVIINEIQPKYFSFIIPSRWLTGGKGLATFRKNMLKDTRFKELYDFKNSKDCFKNVEIEGGICYFLWDKNYNGSLKYTILKNDKIINSKERRFNEFDIFIRDNIGIEILHKVNMKKLKTIEKEIKRPLFGFNTNHKKFVYKKDNINDVKFYCNKQVIAENETLKCNGIGYVDLTQIKNKQDIIEDYKILIPKARGGIATDKKIVSEPILTDANSVCSQTYVIIKTSKDKIILDNFIKYIKTKLFRFLVSLRKQTQDVGISTYSFVPDVFVNPELSNFISKTNDIKEIDEKLYLYFSLSKDEIKYIEEKINYY